MRTKLRHLIYSPMRLIPRSWPYRDKIAHAMIGLILHLMMWYAVGSPVGALVIVLVVELFKELLDRYVIDGTPELMDVLATIALPVTITIGWAIT